MGENLNSFERNLSDVRWQTEKEQALIRLLIHFFGKLIFFFQFCNNVI